MSRKTRVAVIALGVVGVTALSLIFFNRGGNGVVDDGSAFRSDVEIACDTTVYLDNESIALSEASGDNTALRSEALKAFNQVNQIRQSNGLSPLVWDGGLESASAVRAQECSASFSHTRPDGRAWNTVNSAIQGGENLAYGFNDASSAMAGWMGSPTHKDNILYPKFKRLAIAIYVADNGTYYWAQEFGY